jgi:alkaline phosphatase D
MKAFLRRDFLRAVVASAGPVVIAGCSDSEETTEPEPDKLRFFPQSVASGDPRPDSIVLWTRAVDSAAGEEDLLLELEVSEDAEFRALLELSGGPALGIVAQSGAGGAVKVRVDKLAAGTTYYYRFSYERDGVRHHSPTGRTRTAPDPESGATVRFAVVSCQDFVGKYYHVLRHAAAQDLDFVVHLGDYVYETTADPSFQSPTPEREVRLSRIRTRRFRAATAWRRARSVTTATSIAPIVRIRICSACTSSSRCSWCGTTTSFRTTRTARTRTTAKVAKTKRTSSGA